MAIHCHLGLVCLNVNDKSYNETPKVYASSTTGKKWLPRSIQIQKLQKEVP
jgi:hypothetical protein